MCYSLKGFVLKYAIFHHMQLLLKLFITSWTRLILFKAVDMGILWPIDILIKHIGFEQLFDDILSKFIPSVHNPLNN